MPPGPRPPTAREDLSAAARQLAGRLGGRCSPRADPVAPAAYAGTNTVLGGLDAGAVRTVLELSGPRAPITSIVEVRHLGGSLARPPRVPNSVGHRSARCLLTALDRVTDDTADASARRTPGSPTPCPRTPRAAT